MSICVRNAIKDSFSQIQGKRILLYGTGVAARKLLAALEDFQIVGCLDRSKVDGDIEGIPIIIWDDVVDGMADVLIIAAAQSNQKEIYDRIVFRCRSLHLDIYDKNGVNLKEEYLRDPISVDTALYCRKSKEELKKAVDCHDAVSFDLFDTLIMRKVLEPDDIFDLVEERLKEKGIQIPQFKKKRKSAEARTAGGNIDQIYEALGVMCGFDRTICGIIQREEIQCEKDCIIPRAAMVDILDYAVASGKKVNILTDMYLPTPILEEILSSLGIAGYGKLYVSCDYGVSKGDGLFSIYLKEVSDLRYLHIGDNKPADIEAARQYGIDPYYIKSAYEMLEISSIRNCLFYANGLNNRLWIGLLISELFNDPFALHQTAGVVRITENEMFGKAFIAPIVTVYMQKLYEIFGSRKYAGVLFGARDCYLFKAIYDSGVMGKPPIPSFYFLTSRKLAFKSMMQSEKDINILLEYANSMLGQKTHAVLRQLFGPESVSSSDDELCVNMNAIISSSAKTRKNYITYMEQSGINFTERYLFCDLYAYGTSQTALDKIMIDKQDGFYLFHDCANGIYSLCSESLYSGLEFRRLDIDVSLLEAILTSPNPSVCNMGEGGTPIYASEDRNPEIIDVCGAAQSGIKHMIEQYYSLCKGNKNIDKNMAGIMLQLARYALFEGNAAVLNRLYNMNGLFEKQDKIRIGS